jgi:hypothetical protein
MTHDIITTLLYAIFAFGASTAAKNFHGASTAVYNFILVSQFVGFLLFVVSIIGLFIYHPWYVGLICLLVIPNIAVFTSRIHPIFNILCAYFVWGVLLFNIIWAICHAEFVSN